MDKSRTTTIKAAKQVMYDGCMRWGIGHEKKVSIEKQQCKGKHVPALVWRRKGGMGAFTSKEGLEKACGMPYKE